MNLLTWEKSLGGGDNGKRNDVTLFTVHYSATQQKGYTGPRYQLNCLLPSFKNNLGLFNTPAQAMLRAEEAFDHWLNKLDLSAKEDLQK